MKIYLTFLLFFTLVIPPHLSAQQLLLAKTYFNNYAESTLSYDMTSTSDNNFVFTGTAYVFHGDGRYFILKVDANGDTLWFRTDADNVPLSDGIVVRELTNKNLVVGAIEQDYWDRIYLSFYDSTGNLLFHKSFGDTSQIHVSNIFELNGSLYIFAEKGRSTIIVKTNLNGDSITSYTDTTFQIAPFAQGCLYKNNNFIFTGSEVSSSYPNGIPVVVSVDTNGQVIWRQNYPSPSLLGGMRIVEVPGKGYIFSAYSFGGDDIFLIDSIGGVIWQNSLPFADYTLLCPDSSRFLITTGELTLNWYNMQFNPLASDLISLPTSMQGVSDGMILHDTLFFCGYVQSGSSPMLSSTIFASVTDSLLMPVRDIKSSEINTIKLTGSAGNYLLQLDYRFKDLKKVNIYDISGKLVQNITMANENQSPYLIKLNQSLSDGVYIIELNSPNKSIRSRFFISN